MLTVKINEVPRYIELARKSNNNILLVGNPGVGKSQVIGGMASDDTKVTSFTGSSTYEESINGIPYHDATDHYQKYLEPLWHKEMWEFFEKNPNGLNLLFIDEFNTAEPQVLTTFLSILTEKKVPTQPRPLPPNTVIIAAMNPVDQNNGTPLIRPLASRFMTLEVKSTIEGFSEYYKNRNNNSATPVFSIELNEEKYEPTDSQVEHILAQVAEADWQVWREGEYHEICPRSLNNFFNAMGFVKNRTRECSNLTLAFFGKTFSWEETPEEQALKKKKRAENLAKGAEFYSREELEKMTDEELKDYWLKIKNQTRGGNKLVDCRMNCRELMNKRGIKIS